MTSLAFFRDLAGVWDPGSEPQLKIFLLLLACRLSRFIEASSSFYRRELFRKELARGLPL